MNWLLQFSYDLPGGGSGTYRAAMLAYTTEPWETPANAFFAPRLIQPGSIQQELFSDSGKGGRGRVAAGEIRLANRDGGLTWLIDAIVDRRPLTLRCGPSAGGVYPDDYAVVLTGSIDYIQEDGDTLILVVRDGAGDLDTAVCTSLYAGNNALPAGIEGADDLKGKQRPLLFGRCTNLAPILVNTSKLIYQVSAVACNVTAVYDGGVPLTRGSDYADQAAMESTAPGAGQYRVWQGGGCLRLGSTPAKSLTADAAEGPTTASRRPGSLIQRLALAAGFSAARIAADDVAALDTAAATLLGGDAAAECGIWLSDTTTALAAIDDVARSVGAWWACDRYGVLRIGMWPTTTAPVLALDPTNIQSLARSLSPDTKNGLPARRITVRYGRNRTTQSEGDLGGDKTSASDPVGGLARRAWLAAEWRDEVATVAGVEATYPSAPEIVRETVLQSQSGASAMAARLATIFGVRRYGYQLVGFLSPDRAAAMELGARVAVTWPRYNLAATPLWVTGIDVDARTSRVTLSLWG